MPDVKHFEAHLLTQSETVKRTAEQVYFVNRSGDFTIMADHAPLVANLEPDTKVRISKEEVCEEYLLPQGGIAYMKDNLLTIFNADLDKEIR